MQDQALTELCQKIYRKHREAIEHIVKYGEISIFSQLAEEIVTHDGACEVLKTYPKQLWFIPTPWAKIVPSNSMVWSHLSRPVSVACWIDLWRDKVSLVFEVSRMNDPVLRLSCVKALSESGFKLGKMAFREDATYSRFYRASHSVRDSGDEEEVRDAINKLIKKAKEEFPKVEAVLKGVFSTNSNNL